MSNVKVPAAPVAFHDFAKSNGLDPKVHLAMPGGPSETRQEFAAECDINTIMKNYDAYLADPRRSIREPMYYDLSAYPDDLMGFMRLMHEGEAAFMTLPASVRKEFDNDPVEFVSYAADPANVEQMRDWGLAKPKPPEPPAAAPPPREAESPPRPGASPVEPAKGS
ncbi:internal scaffolding protein [robinz microvirus RP_29]|nr:internal scaffolding protein [robinz microvirus RP_29]